MLKVKIRNTIKFPDIDLTPSLKKVADKIVIPLLKENILTNTDIRGRRFPTLSSETIKRKGHSRPLQEEGLLLKAFKRRMSGRVVIVFISGSRNEVARYLQIEGVGKSKKTFKFFGVTDGMEEDALIFMKKEIVKWVKSANRK